MDRQAVATNPGEVVGDAADRVEGRELPCLLEGVRKKFGTNRLDRSIAVGGAQDADAVRVVGIVRDHQVRSGGAPHALFPSGAHEGVAGALGFGYFDWAHRNHPDSSGSRGQRAGGGPFSQVIEKCGCGHGGEFLSVRRQPPGKTGRLQPAWQCPRPMRL